MVHPSSPNPPPLKRKRTASTSNKKADREVEYEYIPPPQSAAGPSYSAHYPSPALPRPAAGGNLRLDATGSHPQPPSPFVHNPASYPTFPPHPPPHPVYSNTGSSSTMSSANGPSRQQQQYQTADVARPSSSSSSGAPLPPLSLSILGVEPLDEFIKEVADFIHHMITTRRLDYEHLGGVVEVEAKIGLLKDRAGQRLSLPVLVESILMPDTVDMRFESNMSASQHKHFNALLNNLKTTSPNAPVSTPLDYSHLYLVDNFYTTPDSRDKIRVTRDEKTSTVVQCVKKIRLGDLNIYSPKRSADWRVSVNLEVPVPHPLGSPSYTRRKDRMRYTHEEFVIDLTQVTTRDLPTSPPQTLHELELEIARPEILLATASKRNDVSVPEHDRSAFDELIRAFVNNARILVRNSSEGWQ